MRLAAIVKHGEIPTGLCGPQVVWSESSARHRYPSPPSSSALPLLQQHHCLLSIGQTKDDELKALGVEDKAHRKTIRADTKAHKKADRKTGSFLKTGSGKK